ncbi:tetratricopeptide repeat protein 17 isoform X2 [Rhynchophorus ferrugineus]|uniref:tetratricopeptide repeat protein 17 isoform X2 n=1 Tax=Rhynchophorus ferrugineus TaxID=354439 RepID=UPI003FCEB584
MQIVIFFYILFNGFARLTAVNHWIVTQTGKIEAYLESPFDLRKPYDLLALLDQETRHNDITNLYEEMNNRRLTIQKKLIDIKENSNIGLKVTSEDADCLAADTWFSDLDLYNNIATNGSERGISITIPEEDNSAPDIDTDNCTKSVLPLCMNFTDIKKFETLVNKTNIVIKPEEALKKSFVPVKSLDHFGNYIVSALRENSTSWVHYNLASFYWRIKGEGDRAIDCLKLAIQFVTGNFQDIPLHNLAGILHQSRHSKEAIQILNSAIQLAPKEYNHYLAMGNIHAALMDFNKSVEFYEIVLEFEPNHKEATNNRHAVLCHHKLERALISFHNDLQSILSDLHDYHSMQQQWLRLQERLMWEHATSFDLYYDTMQPLVLDTPKKVQRCNVKKPNGGKPIISCDFDDQSPDLGSLNLQSLYQMVENEKHKLNLKGRLNLHNIDGFDAEKNDAVFPKFPITMSTKDNQYFDVTGWPKKEDCLKWNLPLDENENFNLPVFLAPENKGYQLKQSLSDFLDLPEGSQHDLPWYPPICEGQDVSGEKFVPASDKNILDIEFEKSDYLKKELLKYVNDGKADEHEIGQRIISAMAKKTAPKWILATLASLYWRVRGNVRRTLDCLDMAFQMAPKDQTDVVLTSLSSVMYQLGFKEQALKYATLAFKINYIEPSTNFLLALLHYENNNSLLSMYYMKNALRVEPEFYDGLAEKLLKIWACRIKIGVVPSKAWVLKQMPDPKLSLYADDQPIENLNCNPDDLTCETGQTFQCKKKDQTSFENAGKEGERDASLDKLESTNLGHQIMASLMAAESSDLIAELRSKLENFQTTMDVFHYPHIRHRVRMGLSLGAEHPLKEYSNVGNFYVSLDVSESPTEEQRLHIVDKYGSYKLSTKVCQYSNLLTPFQYSQLWSSLKDNTLDISPFIKNQVIDNPKDFKPLCMQVLNPYMPYGLNELTLKVLDLKLADVPDKELTELLQLISGNQKLTVRELGIKIAKALSDETNWELLTASAIYWIIYGNTEQAIVCLRGAITKVPLSQLDIPVSFLSHLLWNLGLHKDALDVANLALSVNSNAVWNHFRVGDIYIKVNAYEHAVPFLRASLQIDDKFDPARIRLKAVLCKLLFEDEFGHRTIITKIGNI